MQSAEDDADRVLLANPTYKDGWDIPGGYVETGGSDGLSLGVRSGGEVGEVIVEGA